jgi:tripartite-type tricarboxylate transporter receptor subunit TctC
MRNLPLAVGAAGIALLAGAVLAPTNTEAQTYPVRPVSIIVPNTAGSATDIATRLIAQRLTPSLRKPHRVTFGSAGVKLLNDG